MATTTRYPTLGTGARWTAGVVGLLLLGFAAALIFMPPAPSTIERDGADSQVKRTTKPTDVTTVVLTITLAGVGLILFGVNGLQFTRFSAAGISADSGAIAEEAKKQLSAQEDEEIPPISIDRSSDPDPKPTQLPASTVTTANEDYAIYALGDVPSQVIGDALSNWPTNQGKPANLAEFEFASRKRGKGNNAWQLKFRGFPPVIVTYGGQAKQEATVKPA